MWKTLMEWLVTLLNMTRELDENRASVREQGQRIRELEQYVQTLEESIKLLAQQLQHSRAKWNLSSAKNFFSNWNANWRS